MANSNAALTRAARRSHVPFLRRRAGAAWARCRARCRLPFNVDMRGR